MWEFYFWALVFPQFKSISTVQFRFFKSQLLQRKLQFAHLLVKETFKILLDYIEFLEDMQKIFMEFLCHFMWHLILIISQECFSSQFSVSNLEIFTAWYYLLLISSKISDLQFYIKYKNSHIYFYRWPEFVDSKEFILPLAYAVIWAAW